MKTRYLFSVILLWATFLIWCYMGNNGLPLGFDHGAYKHYLSLIKNMSIWELPSYLQYQFEPFSGIFFSTLSLYIWEEFLFSWGYLWASFILCISLFILWKKSKKYTIWSYLWALLFLFSTVQYVNLWWSFGKQIFTTFFLLLIIRYHKNMGVLICLLSACIWLHRLTGFIALLYLLCLFIFQKKYTKNYWFSVLISVALGIMTYLWLFYQQILSYLNNILSNFDSGLCFLGKYWTGFSPWEFWIRISPVFVLLIYWIILKFRNDGWDKNKKNPELLLVIILTLIVSMRCIAHTRMWSFLDLSIIILITKNLYPYLQKKWVYLVLLVQIAIWWTTVYTYHTPYIGKEEHEIIKSFTKNIPKDVTLVTLSGAYMSWISGYMDSEIYSLYQWVSSDVWTEEMKYSMRNEPDILCENLSHLSGKVVLFRWKNDRFSSLENNHCLIQIMDWWNGSSLWLYRER